MIKPLKLGELLLGEGPMQGPISASSCVYPNTNPNHPVNNVINHYSSGYTRASEGRGYTISCQLAQFTRSDSKLGFGYDS